MQVTCPPNVTAGGQMLVNVPAAPQPVVMATAVPAQPMAVPAQPVMMAAPQPMVMQQPMMGQPPMGQPMAFGQWRRLLEAEPRPCEKGGFYGKESGRRRPVISANEWAKSGALDAVIRQLLLRLPGLRMCVLLHSWWPDQCALCMINPVTCIVCRPGGVGESGHGEIAPIAGSTVSSCVSKTRWRDQLSSSNESALASE